MKLSHKIIIALLAYFFTTTGVVAKDLKQNAIEARQGEMQLRAFNAGPLFAMAKGKIPYDAKKATMHANNLKQLLDIDMQSTWIKGSDNDTYFGETTALPKIWTTYPEIGKYGKKYKIAVDELNAVAGNGLNELRSKVGALGKSCKGCHDEFREKK